MCAAASHVRRDPGRSLFERAYEHIQESIVTGELPAGAVVSEAVFAKVLGISRTPVGEAIRQLAREGFVRQVPRYGTIVKPIDRQELIELYEMREALESYAAQRAAERGDAAIIARLEQFCGVMERIAADMDSGKLQALDSAGLSRFLTADLAFHLTIIESTANWRIMEAVRTMRTLSRIFRTRRTDHDRRLVHKANDFHQEILAAIRGGDGDLARLKMASHIHAGQVESLEYLDRASNRGSGPMYELPSELLKELDALEQNETKRPRPQS
jgi:DNA-binding GntR family transcriptional regulator